MTMKKIMIVTLVVAASLVPAVSIAAHGRGGRRGPAREAMAEKLGMTDAQKQSIRSVRDRHRAEIEPLRDEVRSLSKEYVELRRSGSSAAAGKREQLVRLREEIEIRRIALRAEIHELLTPEQREMIEARRSKRHGRR